MKKKLLVILLALVMVFTLAACNNSDKPNDNDNNQIEDEYAETPNDNGEEDEDVEDEAKEDDSETEKKESEVTLYFANSKYIESGNEDLEQLITETRIVSYEDTSLSQAMVEALIKGPKNDGLDTMIPDNITLIDVKESDNTAFVNFSSDDLSGGSNQESFTIIQIVNSLLELDKIQKVQFLIDGEIAESLMGHIIISEPFTE